MCSHDSFPITVVLVLCAVQQWEWPSHGFRGLKSSSSLIPSSVVHVSPLWVWSWFLLCSEQHHFPVSFVLIM